MITKLLEFHCKHRLAVVQFTTVAHDTLQYISGGRAMKDGLLKAREISEAGSVNHLLVFNSADIPVFLMDGDILVGAKQNRVVNTSMLLAPHGKSTIPVSCVEGGRWRSVSPLFSTSDYTAPAALRSSKARQVSKNLENERGHFSDQGAIWDHVADFHALHSVSSPTASLSDIYEQRRMDHDVFLASFIPAGNANGCAFFVDDYLASVDVFNRRDVYLEYFPKLLRGIGLEVAQLDANDKAVTRAEAEYRTLDFFDTFETIEKKTFRGVSLGVERRFDNEERTGFGLYLDEQLVHLTALRVAK